MLCVVLLAGALGACAMRSPHPESGDFRPSLNVRTSDRLVSVWQQQLGRFITRDGRPDPAVLGEMQFAHARDVLRPARITFGVLDVEASVPGKDGWDLTGVLTGKEVIGDRSWYIFIVGVVERAGYRPRTLVDIRAVGLSAQAGKLTWRISRLEPQAVQRYRETFAAAVPARFPADTDAFELKVFEKKVSIHELRSGAEWSFQPGTQTPI